MSTANVSCPRFPFAMWCRLSICAHLNGALFGIDEEKFSGFCCVVGVFLLLLLVPHRPFCSFIFIRILCTASMRANTKHKHLPFSPCESARRQIYEALLARDFSQHYQWNMHHDCVHENQGIDFSAKNFANILVIFQVYCVCDSNGK